METTAFSAETDIADLLVRCETQVLAVLPEEIRDQASCQSALHDGRAVAQIVAAYDQDPAVLSAVLLRPLLSASLVVSEQLVGRLPTDILDQAKALERLRSFELSAQALRGAEVSTPLPGNQAEGLRRMLLSLVTDPRLVLARIAEQLHTMRLARQAPESIQRHLAEQSTALYSPLANRLGLGALKWELEDLSFRYREPAEYRRIAASLNERRTAREAYIAAVCSRLDQELSAAGVTASVAGRPKHIYSIWRKMTAKKLAFEQVYDVRAVRILVTSVADCYAALGVVHGLWPYIAGEFDDYVATPKSNGYRSIHTAVHGPDERTLEVQIRTHDMHQSSELGVAAHWRYKEGSGRDVSYERKLETLRALLAPQPQADEPADFLSTVSKSLFAEKVYAFTPRGDVAELDAGSTPIDFAYDLHTNLGHRCRGARVNGRMVSLDYRLKNGDSVEIITAKQATPSRDWLVESLGFLATRSARSKVRTFFRREDGELNTAHGKEIYEREMAKLAHDEQISIPELLAELNQPNLEHLHLLLGEGEISVGQLNGALGRLLKRTHVPEPEPVAPVEIRDNTATGIQVMGIGDLLTTYARCCRPVPPEAISGYVTVGRGVTIHRSSCANLTRLKLKNPERIIPVDWGQAPDRLFYAEFTVHASDRRGLVRDVSALLADAKLSIERMNTVTDASGQTADMTISVQVHALDELERVLTRIAGLPDVLSVRRR